MPIITKPSNIDFLVHARYPQANYEASLFLRDPEIVRITKAAEIYRAELEALKPSEVERLVSQHLAQVELAQPFNRPEARADHTYWAKMAFWTLDEAVALSLGRAPRFANWAMLERLVGRSPFATQYAAARELVVRAEVMGQLWQRTIPMVFIDWAERMEFPVATELVQAVRSLGFQIVDWKTLYERQVTLTQEAEERAASLHGDLMNAVGEHSELVEGMKADQRSIVQSAARALSETNDQIRDLLQQIDALQSETREQDLGSRERVSMLKLVIGMAMKGYIYNPTAARNPATSEIAGDLSELGISLDEDTIRKYLVEARELLPREHE